MYKRELKQKQLILREVDDEISLLGDSTSKKEYTVAEVVLTGNQCEYYKQGDKVLVKTAAIERINHPTFPNKEFLIQSEDRLGGIVCLLNKEEDVS
jgi:hypothetical protein